MGGGCDCDWGAVRGVVLNCHQSASLMVLVLLGLCSCESCVGGGGLGVGDDMLLLLL